MRFNAPIECRRTAAARVTLIGRTEGGERAYLTVDAEVPPDLPPRIDDGFVDLLEGGRCRVFMAGREWLLESHRQFLHCDASDEFYAALPPRPVRLLKRMLFGFLLFAAESRAGRWWLAR